MDMDSANLRTIELDHDLLQIIDNCGLRIGDFCCVTSETTTASGSRAVAFKMEDNADLVDAIYILCG